MTVFQPTPDVLRAMLRKAEEKLASARRELQSGYPGEASSRSYYAAFHAISAVLAARGLTYSSHSQTIGAFNREFIKTRVFPADTSRKLHRMFEDRQTADYDLTLVVDKQTAESDVADAEWLLRACRQFLERETGESLDTSFE